MPQFESKLDALSFEIQDDAPVGTKIKVIGIGGAGCNAAGRMFRDGVSGVEFHALDTDRQALNMTPIPNKLLIGHKITNGLGSGADPNVGKEAALEDTERIIEILQSCDMVFLAAGTGGGTGTGAAPVIAALAKELNALTVAIVTKPFSFEGARRMKIADQGIDAIAATVDTLIQIPNERLTSLVPKGTSLLDSFRVADDVLRQAVIGISDIMNTPGLINRDFSDIRSIMQGMGHAMMGTAMAKGPEAAVEAARNAINCPLLEGEEMRGARGILINITASSQISLHDIHDACSLIRNATDNEEVQVNFGIVMDESMGDQVKITVIATGFQPAPSRAHEARPPRTRTAAAAHPPAPVSEPLPQRVAQATEPIPEPLFALEPEPPGQAAESPVPEPAMAPIVDEPAKAVDDIEVPAFLRRQERRFF